EMAATEFATLADSLRARGVDPQRAAHFLMRLLFCLFAEDIGLLPPKLFSVLLERTRHRPADFKARLAQLFAAMATGGAFGADDIAHFNGDLFTDAEVFDLSVEDIETLLRAGWRRRSVFSIWASPPMVIKALTMATRSGGPSPR